MNESKVDRAGPRAHAPQQPEASDAAPLHALEVRDAWKSFGGLTAVAGVDLALQPASVSGLIGPNGAGKSTLFNLVTGVVGLDGGAIRINGQTVTGETLHEVARLGIGRTFQTPCGFESMTVIENLLVVPSGWEESALASLVRGRALRRRFRGRALEVTERLGISHLRDTPYSELSGGELRLLEIGRQLMRDVHVLLLDEPTAGVAPAMQQRLKAVIRELAASGIAVLVVEHNLGFVFDLATEMSVMVDGRVIASGSPEDVQDDHSVVSAYLGDGRQDHA